MSVNILVEARVQPRVIFNKENPILGSGEIGLEEELLTAKIGDGVTHWEDLTPLKVTKETMERWYNIVKGTTTSHLITLPNLNFAYTTVDVDSNPLIEEIVSTMIKDKNYLGLYETKKDGINNFYDTLKFNSSDFFDMVFLTTDEEKKIQYISQFGFSTDLQGDRYYLLRDESAHELIDNLNGNMINAFNEIDLIKNELYSEDGILSEINKKMLVYPNGTGGSGLVPAPASGQTTKDKRFLHISGQWKTLDLNASEITYNEKYTVAQKINDLDTKGTNINLVNLDFDLGLEVPLTPIPICGTIDTNTLGTLYYHSNVYITVEGVLFGAAYNDYAEARQTKNVQAGRVVVENGDDTLSISTDRLQLGGNIVSDTYGMLIGKTDEAKTPIALCGRVLAYPNEDRSEYYAGAPVCTGPNGTVSIMSKDEVLHYPECIIGYVSAVPTYEEWNRKKVDGRIWIKVI